MRIPPISGRARDVRFFHESAASRPLAERAALRAGGFWAGFTDGDFVGWWILRSPVGPDQPEVPGHAEPGDRCCAGTGVGVRKAKDRGR